jgi:hypothetical protein
MGRSDVLSSALIPLSHPGKKRTRLGLWPLLSWQTDESGSQTTDRVGSLLMVGLDVSIAYTRIAPLTW